MGGQKWYFSFLFFSLIDFRTIFDWRNFFPAKKITLLQRFVKSAVIRFLVGFSLCCIADFFCSYSFAIKLTWVILEWTMCIYIWLVKLRIQHAWSLSNFGWYFLTFGLNKVCHTTCTAYLDNPNGFHTFINPTDSLNDCDILLYFLFNRL